jgi:hypothetical protein
MDGDAEDVVQDTCVRTTYCLDSDRLKTRSTPHGEDALHALKRVLRHTQFRSKRSRFITLPHAFTKSRTNLSFPSASA